MSNREVAEDVEYTDLIAENKTSHGDTTLTREIIGEEVKLTRNAKNCNQNDIVEDLDFSQQYLSEIERGETSISVKKLVDIAESLNCNLNLSFEPENLEEFDDDFIVNPNWGFSVQFLERFYEEADRKSQSIGEYVQETLELRMDLEQENEFNSVREYRLEVKSSDSKATSEAGEEPIEEESDEVWLENKDFETIPPKAGDRRLKEVA